MGVIVSTQINPEVPEDQLKVLEVYAEKSEELIQGIIKHIPQKTTVKNEPGKPMQVIGVIDKTAERGLVTLTRQFIDPHETISFMRVANIISRHCNDPKKVSKIREYKRVYKEMLKLNPVFALSMDGEKLNSREIFDLFAYANHIHTDVTNEAKYKKYKALADGFLGPFAQIQLHQMIIDIGKLTRMFNKEFVEPLLDRRTGAK